MSLNVAPEVDSLLHWHGVCERAAAVGPWAEPLNVLSSFLFIIVAIVTYRYYHGHRDLEGRRIWDIHALTFLTFFIGVNSAIFHSFPNPTTELADTIPIVLLIILYFWSVLFRIGRCNLFQASVCFVAFVGFSHMLVSQFPRAMNDSIGYLSSMMALIVIAIHLHLHARPSSQYFMLASLIGVISLFCRVIDHEVCSEFPYGTHFLWHSCNATLIYILMKQIIRNVNRDARLKQLAGDSTMI